MKNAFVFCVLLLAVLLCVVAAPSVSADTADDILTQSGAAELYAGEAAEDFLAEQQISFTEPEAVLRLSPKQFCGALWQRVQSGLTAPLRLFGTMLVITILAALAGGTGDTVRDKTLSTLLELICVLVCVLGIAEPIGDCFRLASDTLTTGGTFMLAYIPVFAAVTAAGGGVVTAAGYQMVLLTAAELAVQVAASVLLPLLQMALAVAIVDAMHPALSLTGLLEALKKCVTWALGLMMAIFGGLLSVQGIFGASADTVTTKATKFMLSSCVPVVGGAVSDAYGTVRGSLGVVRGGIGAVGIAAMAITVLPPILLLLAYRLSLFGAVITAELLDVQPMRRLFRNLETILSIAVGTVAGFSFLLLLSTALMILMLSGM